MTDAQKIKWLTTALRDLAMSADRYIDDGSWIDHLYNDIQEAQNALAYMRLNTTKRSIKNAVSKATIGEKT